MEIARLKSERVKAKRAVFTPGKIVNSKMNTHSTGGKQAKIVEYSLHKRKAVGKKLEAAERTFTVKPEISPGNLVLIFSAAAYAEFRIITRTVLQNSGLIIEMTDTKDKNGALVSESMAVRKSNIKVFVLNFYNTTTKVLLNGKQKHMIEFITTTLSDILVILDRNENFNDINKQIRDYCLLFLDSTEQDNTGEVHKLQKRKSRVKEISCNTNIQQATSPKQVLYSNNQSSLSTVKDNIEINNWLCPICRKCCESDAVECEVCEEWLHYDCERLTAEVIYTIEHNLSEEYTCRSCQELRCMQSELNKDTTSDNVTAESSKCVSIVKQTKSSSSNNHEAHIKRSNESSTSSTHVSISNENEVTEINGVNKPRGISRNEEQDNEETYVKTSVRSPDTSMLNTPRARNEPLENSVNSNLLLREEMNILKLKLTQKEKSNKQKDSQIYKLQTESSSLKKDLSTSRAYAIKLEHDIRELEQSLQIQKQKLNMSNQNSNRFESMDTNHNRHSDYESAKNMILEQRVRQLEFDWIKHENKIDNLNDKLLDLRINSVKPNRNRRTNRNGRKTTRNESHGDIVANHHIDRRDLYYTNDLSEFSDNTTFRNDETEVKSSAAGSLYKASMNMNIDDENDSVDGMRNSNDSSFLGVRSSRGVKMKRQIEPDTRKRHHDISDQTQIPMKKKKNLPPRFQRLQEEKRSLNQKNVSWTLRNAQQIPHVRT